MKRPAWASEAEAMLQRGVPNNEVARRFKKSSGTVTMYAGPKWKAYIVKDYGSRTIWDAMGIKYARGKRPSLEECVRAVGENPDIMEVFLSDRRFDHVKQVESGIVKTGLMIRCHKCGTTQNFFCSTGPANHIHAAKNFRNKGWAIGGGPRADTCPECINGMRAPKVNGHATYKPGTFAAKLQEAARKKEESVVAPQAPASSAAPVVNDKTAKTLKDIDRQTRRIIDAKLDEVYDLSKGGYLEGWNDKRVSQDLGCAVEWVALVRDFGFGPETTAADLSKEVALVKAEFEKLRELKKTLQALIENIEKLDHNFNEKLNEYEKISRDVQVRYDTFMKKWGS